MTWMAGDLYALVAGGMIFLLTGYGIYYLVEHRRSNDNPVVEADFLRGRSLVHHLDYGALELVSFDPDSRTSGLWTGVADGRTYTWVGDFEEFHMRDVAQVLLGRNPEFDYFPARRAVERAERLAGNADLAGAAVRAKRDAERATTLAKLAETNIKQEVDHHVERLNQA